MKLPITWTTGRFNAALLSLVTLTIYPILTSEAQTITAKSAQFADVAAAVYGAPRNATVRVPAGNVNWGGNYLWLVKGIKLIGAGRDNTIINGNNADYIFRIDPENEAAKSDEYRVEGFTLTNATYIISINAPWNGSVVAAARFVIGWNRFKYDNYPGAAIYTRGQTRGVIYKNEFLYVNRTLWAGGYGGTWEWEHFPRAYGSEDNLYFEDNELNYPSDYTTFAGLWIEAGQAGRLVIRYNHYDYDHVFVAPGNKTAVEVWDAHGFQGWYPPQQATQANGVTGTMVWEAYGNRIENYSGNRLNAFRGGWGLEFNNIATGSGVMNNQVWDLVGSTAAWVTGWNGTYDTRVNNTYCWNTTKNGAQLAFSRLVPYSADPGCTVENCHVYVNSGGIDGGIPTPGFPPTLENREYYNYNPNFDGTTGIGTGTTPPTMSAVDGVAYWQCSTPGPTTDPAIVQTGRLWKRVGGAWVEYYRPFTYPHPLRGDPPTPPTPAPSPPSNLRVVPQ